GRRIAYLNGRELSSGRVRLIAADGTPVEVPGGVQANGKLAFHPDGRRLLGSLRAPDFKGGEALAWLDLTTGKVTALTSPAPLGPCGGRRCPPTGAGSPTPPTATSPASNRATMARRPTSGKSRRRAASRRRSCNSPSAFTTCAGRRTAAACSS